MDSAAQFVSKLRSRGVLLWVEEGQIRFRAAPGLLRAPDIEIIRAQRQVMLQLIEQSQSLQDIPLGPRKMVESPVRITANQSMPWNYSQHLGSRIAAMTMAWEISGPLDAQLLRSSLHELQRRHESLRTRIERHNDVIVQRIESLDTSRFDVHNIDTSDPAKRVSHLRECIDNFIAARIDAADGAAFDAMILRSDDLHHILVMSIDHIVTDGISNRILWNDLSRIYGAGAQGRVSTLSPIHVQFPDYAEWLWRCFPTWLRKHAPYWERRLKNVSAIHWPNNATELPESTTFGMVRFQADENIKRQLETVARQVRTIPAMAVLAAYVATICRWSKQKELVVSFIDNGRHRFELDQMVGCLAEHLYLRIEVRGDESFDQLVSRILGEYTLACENRDFGWLRLGLRVPHIYLNYSTFVPPSSGDLCADYDGLKALNFKPYLNFSQPKRQIDAWRGVLPFKLGAIVNENSTFLEIFLIYDEQLLTNDIVSKVGGSMLSVLKSALHNPRRRIGILFEQSSEI